MKFTTKSWGPAIDYDTRIALGLPVHAGGKRTSRKLMKNAKPGRSGTSRKKMQNRNLADRLTEQAFQFVIAALPIVRSREGRDVSVEANDAWSLLTMLRSAGVMYDPWTGYGSLAAGALFSVAEALDWAVGIETGEERARERGDGEMEIEEWISYARHVVKENIEHAESLLRAAGRRVPASRKGASR